MSIQLWLLLNPYTKGHKEKIDYFSSFFIHIYIWHAECLLHFVWLCQFFVVGGGQPPPPDNEHVSSKVKFFLTSFLNVLRYTENTCSMILVRILDTGFTIFFSSKQISFHLVCLYQKITLN